jgi:hypothetical protein
MATFCYAWCAYGSHQCTLYEQVVQGRTKAGCTTRRYCSHKPRLHTLAHHSMPKASPPQKTQPVPLLSNALFKLTTILAECRQKCHHQQLLHHILKEGVGDHAMWQPNVRLYNLKCSCHSRMAVIAASAPRPLQHHKEGWLTPTCTDTDRYLQPSQGGTTLTTPAAVSNPGTNHFC